MTDQGKVSSKIENGNAKIDNSFGVLNISIPSKKNWFALIFATAWLGAWYFGFKSALKMLFHVGTGQTGSSGFMFFWLIAWSVGGIAIVSLLFWGYFGKEKFSADQSEVSLKKSVFGLGIEKKMEASQINNIRSEVENGNVFGRNRWAFWGVGPGKIKFDYGFKTFSFGLGVDDAEANHIVELMKKHFQITNNFIS